MHNSKQLKSSAVKFFFLSKGKRYFALPAINFSSRPRVNFSPLDDDATMKLSCKTFIVSQYFHILQCCLHVFLSARKKISFSFSPDYVQLPHAFLSSPRRGALSIFSSSPIIYVIAQPVFWFNISQDSFYFVYAPAIENCGEMSVDMCFIWSMARAAGLARDRKKETSKLVENNLNEFVN